jgi:type 1 fimbria pilin
VGYHGSQAGRFLFLVVLPRISESWTISGNIRPVASVKADMKTFYAAAGAALLACNLAGFAQTEAACNQTLNVPLRSRAALTIDSRSAGLEIVGTDQETIHLSCTADDAEKAQQILIRFSGNQDDGKLAITGGSARNTNLQIRIEVPRKTSLKVDMPAGQVKVEEIVGDKDIDLLAGQITISSARPWDYRIVNLSVDIGQLRAPVYGADKGGFFRTFRKQTAVGEYGLHAHVITGQIDLQGTNTRAAAE